jgi:hypothetical protein
MPIRFGTCARLCRAGFLTCPVSGNQGRLENLPYKDIGGFIS